MERSHTAVALSLNDLTMTINRRSTIFSITLALLLIIYTAGLLNALFIMAGGQTLNPEIWRMESLPAYLIVFVLGDISTLATLRWRKLGLQGLFVTVLLSGILYLIFGPPFPILGLTFPIMIIIVAVFLLLLTRLNRQFFTII